MRKKIIFSMLFILAVSLVFAPLAAYMYNIKFLESFPEKLAPKSLSSNELKNVWQLSEPGLKMSDVHSITPYWVYSWLASAFFENHTKTENYGADSQLSHMCSVIAIAHLRSLKSAKLNMLDWHLLNIHLTMWLQRNWSEEEIIKKYMELNP